MILLREKRLGRGFSQKRLAELSGVPQQNISAYESNARIPGADSLYALAVALGSTMDELYRPDGGPEKKPDGGPDAETGFQPDGDGKTEGGEGDGRAV